MYNNKLKLTIVLLYVVLNSPSVICFAFKMAFGVRDHTGWNFWCRLPPLNEDTRIDSILMCLFFNEIRRCYVERYGNDNFDIVATFAPDRVRAIRHRLITAGDMDELVDYGYLQTINVCFFIIPPRAGRGPAWKE